MRPSPARSSFCRSIQTPPQQACVRGCTGSTGRVVGVVVSDWFGRPWRQGTTDIAIGAAGVEVLRDLKGERDPTGYELRSTVIAVAGEIAGAAELVMGKLDRTPVAIARGLDAAGDGSCSGARHAGRAKSLPRDEAVLG